MARWQSANVLQTTPGGRQLWRFNANGNAFAFAEEQKLAINEQLPSDLVAKDWRTLLRSKLNVAWLPADKVFLRAVQLPSSDLNEIRSMVELQIEKLSPLPVTQIVWSIQVLPNVMASAARAAEGANAETPAEVPLQTVIVIIAARSYVEEFLGELENQGFLADRLEVPGLEQLVATKAAGNGVWVYPNSPTDPLLIAWWYGGTLHNLAMVSLPETPDRADLLKNQIEQMAWAGELEGWLTEPPKIHLVATPEQAHLWGPLLRSTAESELASPSGSAASIEVVPALKPADAAAKVAESSAADGSTTNLLPDEYARRYRQQFIDGLWMRALFGALVLYGVAVIVYFATVFVLNYKAEAVTQQVRSLGTAYTNALRNEAQLQILKDRQELKYAALDCWKAVADTLGEGTAITIDDLYFQRGKLELRGSVPADQQIQVTDFNDKLRAYKIGNAVLFNEVGPPAVTIRGDRAEWRFSCMMKGADTK